MVFGSNPLDLSGWDGRDGDFLFAQDTSMSWRFAQQWELRMMAQEAVLKVAAGNELR